MFENIKNLFKKTSRKEKGALNSKDAAKERLHLVLMQDRANVSADFLDLMRQEIIEVIKKYIDVDESAIDVRLTNYENEDGSQGAPALYANIPIKSIKEDVRKGKIKEAPKSEKINVDEEQQIDIQELISEEPQECSSENQASSGNQEITEQEQICEQAQECDLEEQLSSNDQKESEQEESEPEGEEHNENNQEEPEPEGQEYNENNQEESELEGKEHNQINQEESEQKWTESDETEQEGTEQEQTNEEEKLEEARKIVDKEINKET